MSTRASDRVWLLRAMCHAKPANCECADGSYQDHSACRIVSRHANAIVDAADDPADPFKRWRKPNEPMTVLPQVLAAECLGIKYGDPGPRLSDTYCRACWGDRHVWLGNVWGIEHVGDTSRGCKCACHVGEMWIAAGLLKSLPMSLPMSKSRDCHEQGRSIAENKFQASV